jgi:hypothetical protein
MKPTCLAKIRSPVSKNYDVFAILSSLQPIRSPEPSVQPLHVLPLVYLLSNIYVQSLMPIDSYDEVNHLPDANGILKKCSNP